MLIDTRMTKRNCKLNVATLVFDVLYKLIGRFLHRASIDAYRSRVRERVNRRMAERPLEVRR